MTPGSPAAAAGFQEGDVVLAINGKPVEGFLDVEYIIRTSADQPLTFTLQRGGEVVTITASPQKGNESDRFGNVHRLGRLGIGGPAMPARVASVQPGTAAAVAGLEPGDVIQAIDGTPIKTFDQLREMIAASPEKEVVLTILRGGRTITRRSPRPRARSRIATGSPSGSVNSESGAVLIPADVKYQRFGPTAAFVYGLERTWGVVDQTFSYLQKVVTGRELADQIGGPIKIAQVSGQMASLGLDYLVNLGGRAVGLDRSPEPLSDTAARWGTPFVLRRRGGARAAVVGTGAGNGFPPRPGAGSDADGLRHLQRSCAGFWGTSWVAAAERGRRATL